MPPHFNMIWAYMTILHFYPATYKPKSILREQLS
ncbi:hypothetical protein PSEUDO8O_50228 [Pseudomonas sp. 8O]|nr:hypothetical protein PSEUDO8O_50228 [Pseudomonas sp. 8O]